MLHWKGCGSLLPRSSLGGQSKRSVWDRLSLHFPPLGNYIFHTHTHTHTVNTNLCHYITECLTDSVSQVRAYTQRQMMRSGF